MRAAPRAWGRRRKPSFVTQCAVAPDLRVGSRGLAEPRAGAGRPPHELQAPGRGGSGPGPLWLRAHPRAAASVLPPAPSGLLAPSPATFSPLPLCPREWPQGPGCPGSGIVTEARCRPCQPRPLRPRGSCPSPVDSHAQWVGLDTPCPGLRTHRPTGSGFCRDGAQWLAGQADPADDAAGCGERRRGRGS